MRPLVHIPGMGHTLGPPTDAELGHAEPEMPPCVCGCPLADHAEAPDLPCTTCTCTTYLEDET